MDTEPVTPTLAAIRLARAQRDLRIRRLRPAGSLATVLMTAIALRAQPMPGLHGGAAFGVLLSLAAAVLGAVGALTARGGQRALAAGAFTLLLAGSGGLVWLQPKGGAGGLGFMVAAFATMRLVPVRRWRIMAGAGISALSLGLIIAAAAVRTHGHAPNALNLSLGFVPWAVIAVSLLAQRLDRDSYQIERLLLELEGAQDAEVRAAALAERQRLAREMHDVLAHSLSALALQLEGARLLAVGDHASAQLTSTIERAHHLARSGLAEARRAIGMLRDEELPGPERIAALAAGFARDSGLSCEFTTEGQPHDLDPEARLALYRVAQEALTNIRKHARPGRVEVRLGYEADGTRLTVEDFGRGRAAVPSMAGAVTRAPGPGRASAGPNGAGPNGTGPGHGTGGGYGLAGMRERAELIGGRLAAQPTAGGFRVELWVPA